MLRSISCLLAAGLIVLPGCSRQEAPLTPEQSRARGDELLRKMSATTAGLTTFSYTAEETRDRVSRTGAKTQEHATRKVVVRRPDRLMFTQSGDRGGTAWYDGKSVTVVMNDKKVWARGPMPATLDEALDYVSVEYAMAMPTADILYSNPYEALISPQTTGGWVNVENVGTRSCDHLSYNEGNLEWHL
jgi:hypothetical protein